MATIVPVTRTALTIGSAGSWVDVDVSSYVDAGNTAGVLLEVVCSGTGASNTFGVRKNGSTDTITQGITGDDLKFIAVGVDSSDIFEAYAGTTSEISLYIVGYVPSSAGSFFTNLTSHTVTAGETWEDWDLSSLTSTDTAKVGFFLVDNTSVSTARAYGMRENGSTDVRQDAILTDRMTGATMTLDASEIVEIYAQNDIVWYFSGYLKDSIEITSYANAKDYSTATTASWVDVDFSTDTSSFTTFVLLHLYCDLYNRNMGIRKNGATHDNYAGLDNHSYGYVEVDSSQIAEQKISDTNADLFLTGYIDNSVVELAATDSAALTASGSLSTGTVFVGSISGTLTTSATILPERSFQVAATSTLTQSGTLTVWSGSFSDYCEAKILDHIFGISSFSQPALYVALSTSNPKEDGTGVSEPGNTYARVLQSSWSRTGDDMTNNSNITFPTATASWGTITHYALFDASSGGNMILYVAFSEPVTITASQTFVIQSGAMSFRLV